MFLRDGKTATVSLVRNGGTISIQTNGKPDAAIEMGDGPPASDEITMIMAGALPLSMHPCPRTVANIGIGSGLTSQVLLSTDAVESLTSIEIEPFMVEAARQGIPATSITTVRGTTKPSSSTMPRPSSQLPDSNSMYRLGTIQPLGQRSRHPVLG